MGKIKETTPKYPRRIKRDVLEAEFVDINKKQDI
jgi:hypothetical protein